MCSSWGISRHLPQAPLPINVLAGGQNLHVREPRRLGHRRIGKAATPGGLPDARL